MTEGLKVRTSVTLPKDLLVAVDLLSGAYRSRSELIAAALRAFVAQAARRAEEARDLEIINQHVPELNEEAVDVLDYQMSL